MMGLLQRGVVSMVCALAVAAPAAAGCFATSGLELSRGAYTALAAPPEASHWSKFLFDGDTNPDRSLAGALLAATAAGCAEEPAARQAALDQLDAHFAAAEQVERAVIALHRLELGFNSAERSGAGSSIALARSVDALASDDAVPPSVRAAATGLAAQMRALAALAQGDDVTFAQSMREAEAAGSALADAAPLEASARVNVGPVRGRYLHYGHAARMLRLWTDQAQSGQRLDSEYVIETLAQQSGWSVEDMGAAYAAMDAANRARLARDAALFRFGVAQRRLDESIRFEHAPYLWAAGRLQVAQRLDIEADRDDLSDAQRLSRTQQAVAIRTLAERASTRR
jgi:hypothetical protein